MTKSQNAPAPQISIKVTASTNNPKDEGYYHCFEQNANYCLTFEVEADPSVDSIYFVLWNLHDPVRPKVAEPATDWDVDENGKATITVGPDLGLDLHIHPHLGPGPYCATLTASRPTAALAASKGDREIVGNAVYYYDTWKDGRPYRWPV